MSEFVKQIKIKSAEANQIAVDRGWRQRCETVEERAMAVALVHEEASEWLSAIRKDIKSDSHIPDFTGEEAELADIIIRCMNYAGRSGSSSW